MTVQDESRERQSQTSEAGRKMSIHVNGNNSYNVFMLFKHEELLVLSLILTNL